MVKTKMVQVTNELCKGMGQDKWGKRNIIISSPWLTKRYCHVNTCEKKFKKLRDEH